VQIQVKSKVFYFQALWWPDLMACLPL